MNPAHAAAGFKDSFIYTSPAEALMLYMKMAFFVGNLPGCAYILWEIWGFISARPLPP